MKKGKAILNWLKIEKKVVNDDEYNEILKECINKYDRIVKTDIRRLGYFINTFQQYESVDGLFIRCFTEAVPTVYFFPMTGITKKTIKAGKSSYDYINYLFKEEYGDDVSLFKAFSGLNYKKEYTDIKKCVITQVDYVNETIANSKVIVNKCFKSDLSSAYPAQLIKNLPTLHDCKRIKGRVEPTADYPFAFYIKSHHVKIYNELYTKDFENSKYYDKIYFSTLNKWKPNDTINKDDDETILCKESQFSLKELFQQIYNDRNKNPEMKLYMNACIGYFHKNSNPILSHIAAVVLARCANEMIKRAEIIRKEGNLVLLINTDSIIWRGKQSSVSVPKSEKEMGKFVIEYENIKVAISSVKAYQLETDNGIITRHSGLDKNISRNLKFGEIYNPEIKALEKEQFIYMIDSDGFIDKFGGNK